MPAATGSRDPELLAFADPAGHGDEAHSDALARRSPDLGPLPFARREVESIARHYPDSSGSYFGDAASEARAKALSSGPRYIHFASHGVIDARFPLDSYLVLSPGVQNAETRENGLLQAWEVFEQMRIDAELVTLSACNTGIGAEGGGEGLIGLTRAFQYAGARSVLASLWPVADRSTSILMSDVYRELASGSETTEALRTAQLRMLGASRQGLTGWFANLFGSADPEYAHPYYWAAFQLSGGCELKKVRPSLSHVSPSVR